MFVPIPLNTSPSLGRTFRPTVAASPRWRRPAV